jgi:Uncharacterized conserved protein (DUF2285)
MSQGAPAAATFPPDGDELTAYDRAHYAAYLRLLDAHAMGVDWKETARSVLSLDPADDVATARRVYDAHLARARWMTQAGYRQLLK